MKRLMLLLLLSTTAVQAADFNKTWNDVHNSRVTSAGKAVLTGVMGYYTLFAAWRNIQGFCGDISNLNCPSWRHFNNLIVHGALMVEPTETESKRDLDMFIAAMKNIAIEAKENPELLKSAPHGSYVRRLDETKAARQPVLKWTPEKTDEPG